jgi:DNA-3-methyladenine glycosylase II
LLIDLPEPFDVDLTLRAALASSFGNHYRLAAPRRVRRLFAFGGTPAVVEFGFQGEGLEARLIGAGTGAGGDLATLARRIWSLDDDLAECSRVLARAAGIGRLAVWYRGLRILRAAAVFEALLVAVVGQAISAAAAREIRRRLAHEYGTSVRVDGIGLHADPSPEQLLAAGLDGLVACGLTTAKARCLLDAARRGAAGELEAACFAGMSNDEAVARLTEMPGVGRWTAQVVLVYGLGRNDVFMAGDRALANAVGRLLGREARPVETELGDLAEAWRPWGAYAGAWLMREAGEKSSKR